MKEKIEFTKESLKEMGMSKEQRSDKNNNKTRTKIL